MRAMSGNDRLFIGGTERDNVARWRAVYKIHHRSTMQVTFMLTGGGHNAGIVSAGHPRRAYRDAVKDASRPVPSPEKCAEVAEAKSGSCWDEWAGWLAAHSGEEPVPAPSLGFAEEGCPVGRGRAGHLIVSEVTRID